MNAVVIHHGQEAYGASLNDDNSARVSVKSVELVKGKGPAATANTNRRSFIRVPAFLKGFVVLSLIALTLKLVGISGAAASSLERLSPVAPGGTSNFAWLPLVLGIIAAAAAMAVVVWVAKTIAEAQREAAVVSDIKGKLANVDWKKIPEGWIRNIRSLFKIPAWIADRALIQRLKEQHEKMGITAALWAAV